MSLIGELNRRNVIRVGTAYIVAAWLVIQVVDTIFPAFGFGDATVRIVTIVFAIGLIPTLIFAWAFELTPEGLKKESEVDRSRSTTPYTGKKLDRMIMVVLALALGYFAFDKFILDPVEDEQIAQSARQEGRTTALVESRGDKSIAVLPFENRSNREEDDFFVTGIHDDLLTQLSQIGALRVISRTSVAQFKDTTLSIREIAELLNVSSILEGGVQRAGNQVRINMQLIDAATDGHLWAETYDREMTVNNIFSIQSEVAQAVTEAMRATLTPEEHNRLAAAPTESMDALELYFKGRAEMDQRTLPSIESARTRFEEARTIDPGFALAWAGEAQAILLLSDSGRSLGQIPIAEALELAAPQIERAYELAPEDSQVLGVYGLVENESRNFERAEDFYRRSLAINPSSAEVLNWRRINMYRLGRAGEARELAQQMVLADPMSMNGLFNAVLSIRQSPDHDPAQVEQLLARLERLDKGFGLFARSEVALVGGSLIEAVRYGFASLEAEPGRTSNSRNLSSMLLGMDLIDEAGNVNPELDAYDIAVAENDVEAALNLARKEYADDPDTRKANIRLINAVVAARSDPEEAMPAARHIWNSDKDKVWTSGYTLLIITFLANQGEYPAEVKTWREAAAQQMRSFLESGRTNEQALLRIVRFWHTVLVGSNEDALDLLEPMIRGGYRDRFMADDPGYATLRAYPRFQALIALMNETIEQERRAVVEMLCGPDTILTSWEPAPETCFDE